MNFEQAMIKHKGTWDGDFALIRDRGYVFKIAKKTDAGIELLFDAKRYVTDEAAAPAEPAPAEVVAPEPEKAVRRGRGKKAAEPEVVAPTNDVDAILADLDFEE